MQLTRTDAVFSRIALVSRFCAEIQLPVKIREKSPKIIFLQKTHGARIRDGEGARAANTHRWCGPALAVPPLCVEAPGVHSASPLAYIYPLTTSDRGTAFFFPDRLPLRRHHQKPRFGTRNSVLAPCRDGDSEEIFITITTDAPPSTIHDSPIHV